MIQTELVKCLQTGFINSSVTSDERYLPRILINSSVHKTKVLNSVVAELEKCHRFDFAVAFVTDTGVACLRDTFRYLEKRGVKGRILASQYQNFTEPTALEQLCHFKNLEVRIVPEVKHFHAKGYIFHRDSDSDKQASTSIIVGSSNLTQNALGSNEEWNLFLTSMREGALVHSIQKTFEESWATAIVVTPDWIEKYKGIYRKTFHSVWEETSVIDKDWLEKYQQLARSSSLSASYEIQPNKMQSEALVSLAKMREEGRDRALLISATGTGKTFLSAFDARNARPKTFLFLVHRRLIAEKAKESFEKVFDGQIDTGIYSGDQKEVAPYLFATIQTMAKDSSLEEFAPDYFDYIVIDEVHHAGAMTYQKVLEHFKPKFLLGMTATPERSDGYDIFADFNHNIAYEIRLHQALAEEMLVPFHYHGVSEITVDGKLIDDHTEFKYLVSEDRVKHILGYAGFYGCDNQSRIKGLVFCSNVAEAQELSYLFRVNGKRCVALSGMSSEADRIDAITRLESDDIPESQQLDYIFSVDIFNEGIDIPAVNQVLMLRPTQSAIIFVQQLGRGLRKFDGKRYLEVVDFIGNYENNFLLPIALFGDRSWNKEKIRKTLHTNFLPGASTVHFDEISKERIFNALNSGRIARFKGYKESYDLLKFKIGRMPMMMDFIEHGDKDPYLFIGNSCYPAFIRRADKGQPLNITQEQERLLTFISIEVANGKRLEEIAILLHLLNKGTTTVTEVMHAMQPVPTTREAVAHALKVLNSQYFTSEAAVKKYGQFTIVESDGEFLSLSKYFQSLLTTGDFKKFLVDVLQYGEYQFKSIFAPDKWQGGFLLYENYSRKDVCRLLMWNKDESSTVYGYRVKDKDFDTSWDGDDSCPMFVTYNKKDDISASTQYDDRFVSPQLFHWQTRNRVNVDSREVQSIRKDRVRKLLFIKKSDAEGADFYFMGDVKPEEIIQSKITNDKGVELPIVKIHYKMLHPVDDNMYEYFEGKQ